MRIDCEEKILLITKKQTETQGDENQKGLFVLNIQ